MHVDEEGGQSAKTRYRVLDRAGNRAAWVELHPLTGRTHQLRVHMAAIGHPIVGDGKYGGQEAFLSGTISRKMHLHARRLIIEHPDGAPLDVTAPLPEHFANSLEALGFDEADGAELADTVVEFTKDDEKRAAKAHAKQYRKERRGERRSRRDGASERPGSRGKPSGKAAGKPGGPKSGPRKATGKVATGKPGTGKPGGARKPSGPRTTGGSRPPAPRGKR
jgi:23S rRNA pseudouridine955/2504/2580 synthase